MCLNLRAMVFEINMGREVYNFKGLNTPSIMIFGYLYPFQNDQIF